MGGRGVWVVAAMWDPEAMSWSRVEGMEPGSRAWGPWNGAGSGERAEGAAWRDGVGRAGRAERAGMDWGPFKSSDRGMGPRGHGKGAWRGRVCGWWQCETWAMSWSP